LVLGVLTGGFLGTIARKLTRGDADPKTKLMVITGATVAAVAAGFAITPPIAAFLLLGGWLKWSVIGTAASFFLAEPGLKSNAELQEERRAAAERHFQPPSK
jgi:hypothetical protein